MNNEQIFLVYFIYLIQFDCETNNFCLCKSGKQLNPSMGQELTTVHLRVRRATNCATPKYI